MRKQFLFYKHASLTADALHTSHLQLNDRWSLSWAFLLLHSCMLLLLFYIKLHDSTVQRTHHQRRKENCRTEGGKMQENVKLMSFTLIPHLFPPKSEMAITAGLCRWRPEEAKVSHGEGDEAVVSLDVPLQDLWAQSQHAFKADPVQLHAFEGTPGDDRGCPGAVQQQCDFTWAGGRGEGGGSAPLLKVSVFSSKINTILYLGIWETHFQTVSNWRLSYNSCNIALMRFYTFFLPYWFPING